MQKSFTLLELTIVIIIIAIMTSIAYPHLIVVIERARAAEAMVTLQTLLSAQKRYYEENDNYSGDINDLDVEISPLEYFDNPAVTTSPDSLATIQRNANQTSFLGTYNLSIGDNSEIECDDSGSGTCAKIGY
ncbi:MAG: prepilin-type N-terminal cleavage/methylation domain-containing protein [Candidatus Omnitrophica bacterium]|nr:prepilin-type N-terminal cleavage/methylation domain-containing protein [Candidatus Omnitrophota bacterium]